MVPVWRPVVRRAAVGLLAVAALAFLGGAVARDWARLRGYAWHVQPAALSVSVALGVGVFAFGVAIWRRVLQCFGPRVGFVTMLRVWAFSNVTRYIPGMVWQLVTAAELGRGAGVPADVLLASLIVHLGLVLLSAAVVAAATLAALGLPLAARWPWAVAGVPLVLLAVHPATINLGLRLVNRVTRRQTLTWRGRWRHGIELLVLQIASWLAYGVAFYVFVGGVVAVPASRLLALIGVNALGFVAGYVVLIAPAGLGAREAALVVLLGRFFPTSVAALLAILSRLWTIAAELSTAVLAVVLTRVFADGVARSAVARADRGDAPP